MRLAAELDKPAVVHDAVDDGDGHLVVSEDRPPAGEFEVGRDDDALLLVGVGEHLEDEARAVGVERQEPVLVGHEHAGSRYLRHLPVEPALPTRALQAHDEWGSGEEPGLEPSPACELVFDSFRIAGLSAVDFRKKARKSFRSERGHADHPVRPTVVVASVTTIEGQRGNDRCG